MANADVPIYATQLPRIISANGVSIREDVLYTDAKGEPTERSKKRAEDALADLRDVLPSLLEPKETILYVIKSCQAPMGALEQLFLGWYVYRVTATRLVFTNLRLLHFGLESGKKWNRVLKSVRWGDVAEAKVKGWLNRILLLRCNDGKKEKYWRLARKDGQKAKVAVDAVVQASRGEATPAQGFQSLCPECRAPLTAGIYQCSGCGLKFKDEKTLLKRTVLIPGGGYLYSGMTMLGLLGFVEGALMLGFIFSVLIAVGVVAPGAGENGRPAQAADYWVAAIFLGILVALNKALEYLHSRRVIRNFVPIKRP